jgi:hypothetical protein
MHADVVEFRKAYESAKSALDKVTYISYYPKYPEEIKAFFNLCMTPPWMADGYDAGKTAELLERADTLSFEEIQQVLMAANRSERFGDGSYVAILRENSLEPVISRLELLFPE